MQTIQIETFREFAQRHGGQQLNVGGQLVFADGASCGDDGESIRSEPPRDSIELIIAKLAYWRQAVRVSEKDFVQTKSNFAQQAALALRYGNLPSVSQYNINYLNEIAAAVRRARDEVGKLETELDTLTADAPERHARQFRIQQEQESQAVAAQLLHQIENISI